MKALILLAEGFEEIEAIAVIDILRRADIEIIIAGLKNGSVEGSHKIKIVPDTNLDSIKASEFDCIILPGGFPGYVNLGNDDRVLSILREADKEGKYVAAICGAPLTLQKAEIIRGRRVTMNPSGKDKLAADTNYSEDRVVTDGKLITSQAPGTAMEFALDLVEVLAGEEKMKQIKAQTLAIYKG